MIGNRLASTMHDEALQNYIDLARSAVDDDHISNESVVRIARSHQNVNAKLAHEQERVRELTDQLNAAHLRISRAYVALAREN